MLKALENSSPEQQQNIAFKVFEDTDRLSKLAQTKTGHQLISTALMANQQYGCTQLMKISQALQDSQASGNKHVKHVLRLLEG